MQTLPRRQFLSGVGALSATAALPNLSGCATAPAAVAKAPIGRVVIIGGGYGGATAAHYLALWSGGNVDVTVLERNPTFISCPISNLVIGGSKTLADVTRGYDGLKRLGIKVVTDEATAIDADKKQVRLASGTTLPYDRLIVSPGIDMMFEALPGLANAATRQNILQAWKAGPETLALRAQLTAMRDGGVYVLSIPRAPYRCPPGPYERACQVAHYFKQAKPRSKVLVLDANDDIVSKAGLFKKAFADLYKGIIEYRPMNEAKDVDVAGMAVKTDFDTIKGDVLNVLPPMRAGDIARNAGLITANNRWCGVDWMTTQSTVNKDIHVLGDATLSAPLMPKSGHMANQHGKLAAAAILNAFAGLPPNPEPVVTNTCYSFVTDKDVVHVASVHRYDAAQKTLVTVMGSGGVSAAASALEGEYALAWATNIWNDTLGLNA
jgi:sulfide dehydrogenase [flavocytochrome c] flavoprotein chain